MKRLMLGLTVAFACFGVGVGGVRHAAAATWTVCASGCSFTTIQSAINAPTVHSGDTIQIKAGTYGEKLTIPGTNPNAPLTLTLAGAGEGSTKIDGGGVGTTVSVNSGQTVTISGVTVTDGKAYPVSGILNLGTLTLDKVTVSGNQDPQPTSHCNAGGIASTGTLTLTHSTVTNNSGCEAGGIDNIGGTLALDHTTVSNNTATSGNGGGILTQLGPATLNGSTVSGNSAAGKGGGIFIVNGAVTLDRSAVEANTVSTAADGGGVFLVDCGSPTSELTMKSSTVDGNLPSGSDIASGQNTLGCPS